MALRHRQTGSQGSLGWKAASLPAVRGQSIGVFFDADTRKPSRVDADSRLELIIGTSIFNWRYTMSASKSLTAAALLLIVPFTPLFAQTFSEPAAFASQHPDRDVLNGGTLTPAARAANGLESFRGLYDG